jgi:hypothetical protein
MGTVLQIEFIFLVISFIIGILWGIQTEYKGGFMEDTLDYTGFDSQIYKKIFIESFIWCNILLIILYGLGGLAGLVFEFYLWLGGL